MRLVDRQQQRMLERLQRAGEQPVALDELRAGGIDFPAVVVSELELNGSAIERVYEHGRLIGVRLRDPKTSEAAADGRRRWARRTASRRRAD